ncbi:MAG: hypothetical protein ACK4L8_05415 [Nitrincola lacisaponensis]|uniref:Uncharacterized protein n=1 Tax=Nitrincola lacisaponensis TaxID=267850 RepID=A0A063XYA1_9GAMM|nr:hypothetical protein [Nitrincola lacisaponensis]KDE39128.1 hypothetical protein ADINL_2257 [Nitrincola lacisaponensis]
MTPTETAAIILTGVFFMAMVAIAIQSAENQRRERQMQLLSIRNRIRGTEHLLDNLPAEFQSKALRSLLIQALRNLWVSAARLDRNPGIQEALQKLDEREKEPFTPPGFPANQITLFQDRNTAQRNRSLVRETAQLIMELKQQNALSSQAAQQQLVQLKVAYQRCSCDLLIMEAQHALNDRGPQVAIHKFRSATMQLRRLNHQQQLEAQLSRLNTLIQELETQLHTDSDSAQSVPVSRP